MMIEVKKLPEKGKYPFKVFVDVDFPGTVKHNGQDFWFTGKVGLSFKEGLPCAEYEGPDYSRCWLSLDGTIKPE